MAASTAHRILRDRGGSPRPLRSDVPGEVSNGFGEMDVWEVSFDCGLRAELLLLREYGVRGEPVAIGSPGDRVVEVYASDTERAHLEHHLGGRDWSPFLPDHTREDPRVWVVQRSDDNGNVFEVERFSHRCGAEALAAELSARATSRRIGWSTGRFVSSERIRGLADSGGRVWR